MRACLLLSILALPGTAQARMNIGCVEGLEIPAIVSDMLAVDPLPAPHGSPLGSGLDYASYPVQVVFHGHGAKPRFSSPLSFPDGDLRFREAVEFNVRKGANFAGAFTIVQTSCGTGCSYVVVVDDRTGKIFEDLPFRVVVVGGPHEYGGLSFRLDSRLLVIEGVVDGSGSPTRSYYEWEGARFRLITRGRITP